MVYFNVLAFFYPFYFLMLLFFLFVLLFRSFHNTKKLIKDFISKNYFILFLLIIFGFIIRARLTHHVDLDPYGWRYLQDSFAIKYFFRPSLNLPFRISEALHIPGYAFLISLLPIKTESLSIISTFNLGFSVLTIVVVYFIAYILTKEKFSSILTAGMLAFSQLHIVYSGQEFPMSISVFFVSLGFLYIFFWLETKNDIFCWISAVLFLISVNIKIENISFMLLFGLILLYKVRQNEIAKTQIKKIIKYFLFVVSFSIIFTLPFIINLAKIQHVCLMFSNSDVNSLFSFEHFFIHFNDLFIHRIHGFPIFIIIGYLALKFVKKSRVYNDFIFGWILLNLPTFFIFKILILSGICYRF